MVHILQNDREYNHVHGDDTVKLSHATCIERIPEEQVQKDFDFADPDTVTYNTAAVEHRHEDCHKPPPKQKKGYPKPNQLSLTLLRSCRQVYFEAKMVHYANSTFAINCNDVLERFVRARFQNKQNLAIRSLYLDVTVTHQSSVSAWSDSIDKAVLRHLKSVRHLYLNFEQLYCTCSVEMCGYEGSEMTERQGKMFKKFNKLPLKEVTLVINDGMFTLNHGHGWTFFIKYAWTMKQKQQFSKGIRNALLRPAGEKK